MRVGTNLKKGLFLITGALLSGSAFATPPETGDAFEVAPGIDSDFIRSEPVASSELPPRIVSARDRFGYLLNEATIKKESALQELNAHYLVRLADLERTLRSRGDLAGITATRSEIERFRRDETPPLTDQPVVSQELRSLQIAYLGALASGTFMEIAQDILQLTDRYWNGLQQSKRDAIRQDRIPVAQAIHGEMQRVMDHPERTWALSIFQAAGLVQDAIEEDRRSAPAVAVWGDGVYPLGEEPTMDFSERVVRHTQHSRALAHRARLQLLLREEPFVSRDTQSRYSRELVGEFAHYPRLILHPSPRETLSNCTVVFQYYARPLAGGPRYVLKRTEHIPLPRLARGQAAVIDGAGIRLPMAEYRSRHFTDRTSGFRHMGVIVSVYDENGRLVAQGTDQLSLADEASARIPDPLNDTRGEVYRVSSAHPMF